MEKIAFNDLGAQYRHLKDEIDKGIADVISGCHFISGPQTEELEKELCSYTGRKYCVSTSNGTDALLMPLMAKGIGAGDAVFVPAFTFFATAEVASFLGATPVFCDVDEDTFDMDPKSLEKQIEKVIKEGKLKPKAVIAVDLFGQPADFTKIEPICKKYGLFLMEDAAQGFGGVYKGRKAGALGAAGATSFFPAKPLGCFGDGGAVFTDDDALADVLRSIRVHGKGGHKYDNVRIGLNCRLDTLQAAVLLAKLPAFPGELDARDAAAARYDAGLAGLPGLTLPVVPEGCRCAWAQYTLSLSGHDRDAVAASLREAGVPSMVYYPKPLHTQTAFAGLGHAPEDFPESLAASANVLSLPLPPYLTADVQDVVIAAVGKALQG